METYRRAISVTLAVLICSTIWSAAVNASDPDPVVDFSPLATTFVLRDVFKNGEVFNGPGGARAGLNPTIFPAMTSQGITLVQFKLKPCGENPPHTHPRATEILTLISGGPIQAGFVDTAGKGHIYILYPGDVIIFPRALLHYEVNVGTKTAFFVSGLNSQDPGTLTAAGAVLALPNRAAAGALNTDLNTIALLKKGIYPYSPALQLDKQSGCVPGENITTYF